jgi:hypothetical protein
MARFGLGDLVCVRSTLLALAKPGTKMWRNRVLMTVEIR